MKLSHDAILQHVSKLDDWQYSNDFLEKTFTFKDFDQAFIFMQSVAKIAQQLDHHPDWSNVYNKVSFKLNTHSEGGITLKDFELARKIDVVFMDYPG